MIYHKIWDSVGKSNKKKLPKIYLDDVDSTYDIQYGKDAVNNVFDLHFPKNAKEKLPTIFIIHGGGHIGGNKGETDKYAKLLAQKGFCTINMEYTKCDGPEKKYFVNQLAEFYDLYDYLTSNKQNFKNIDFDNIFLAGDSAGAHIASMIANIQSNKLLDGKISANQGLKIKGLVLVSPIFGPVIATKSMVFGKNENTYTKWECNAFNTLSRDFPPAIMFSAKTDFLTANFKNKFFKKANKLGLNVKHFEILKAHKLFHDSLINYAEYYPNCIREIESFVKDVTREKIDFGFKNQNIFEKSKKETKKIKNTNHEYEKI